MNKKIMPCLWFDNQAEAAMNYYVSVFSDARIVSIMRYPTGYTEGPLAGMDGKVLTAIFELKGQRFMCLDGGPIFKFSEATSFYVECADQAEVDYYWQKLSAVPANEQCGWCKDKFGLSWQIIPEALPKLLNDPDRDKSRRVMDAMMNMKKIVVADLEAAANA